jgi:hypothetical protein
MLRPNRLYLTSHYKNDKKLYMSDAVNVGSNLSEQTKRLFDKRRISKMYDREGRRKAFLAIQEAKNERACLQDRISAVFRLT